MKAKMKAKMLTNPITSRKDIGWLVRVGWLVGINLVRRSEFLTNGTS